MSAYDRTIQLNELIETEVDALLLWDYSKVKVKVNGEPAWFVETTDLNGYSSYFTITAPVAGTYTYQVEAWNIATNTFIEFAELTLNVGETFEDIDNCCSDNNVNIVWLNRQGGRANFIFTQRKDFKVEIGKTSTYISNDIKRFSEINGVYNGKVVYSTGLTQSQVDYLDTLRYGIQAWEFNQTTLEFKPILIDIGSFTKYTTKEKMYELSISYIYAEQLNIQTQ